MILHNVFFYLGTLQIPKLYLIKVSEYLFNFEKQLFNAK